MPLYDITCDGCGHTEEIFRSLGEFDKPLPFHCFHEMRRVLSAPQVMSDIQPYQAMGVDIASGKAPMITSRSQHRDYLKRNGYVEVGNEKLGQSKRPEPTKAEIARDVKRSIEQVGAKL